MEEGVPVCLRKECEPGRPSSEALMWVLLTDHVGRGPCARTSVPLFFQARLASYTNLTDKAFMIATNGNYQMFAQLTETPE